MPDKPRNPRKLTPNQQEYQKELQRIQRFIKRAQSRGYTFPENIIPARPKRITKASVERLQKLKPDVLYKKATYTTATGQKISGTQARKQERKKSSQKAARTRKIRQEYYDQHPERKAASDVPAGEIPSETDAVLNNVEDMINNWTPDPRWSARLTELKRLDKDILANALANEIATLGRETVARNLQAANDQRPGIVAEIAAHVCYGSGNQYAKNGHNEVQDNIKKFIELCRYRSLSKDEAMDLSYQMDAMAYVDDTDE